MEVLPTGHPMEVMLVTIVSTHHLLLLLMGVAISEDIVVMVGMAGMDMSNMEEGEKKVTRYLTNNLFSCLALTLVPTQHPYRHGILRRLMKD